MPICIRSFLQTLVSTSLPNTAPDERRDAARRAPDLRTSARATLAPHVICVGKSCRCGGGSLRTPCGQSGSLRGPKLVLAKRRCLAPGWCPISPTSTPAGAYLLQGATQTRTVGRQVAIEYFRHVNQKDNLPTYPFEQSKTLPKMGRGPLFFYYNKSANLN